MKKNVNILKFSTLILGLMFSAMLFTSCGDDDVSGCTNAAADNYNAEATMDDGSCIISGCTDVAAENYNSNATTDDGSCEFARDKFLGSYLSTLACPGALAAIINNDSLPISITEGFGDVSTVLINLEGSVPVSFAGTASGNEINISTLLENLPIDLTGDGVPEMVDLQIGGTLALNGSDLTGIISITVIAPFILQQEDCDFTGVKQ